MTSRFLAALPLSILLFSGGCMDAPHNTQLPLPNKPYQLSQPLLYYAAVLVSTNLVSRPCPCGFCDSSRGIVVPEHFHALGYDTYIAVTTNFLPIVRSPLPQ